MGRVLLVLELKDLQVLELVAPLVLELRVLQALVLAVPLVLELKDQQVLELVAPLVQELRVLQALGLALLPVLELVVLLVLVSEHLPVLELADPLVLELEDPQPLVLVLVLVLAPTAKSNNQTGLVTENQASHPSLTKEAQDRNKRTRMEQKNRIGLSKKETPTMEKTQSQTQTTEQFRHIYLQPMES